MTLRRHTILFSLILTIILVSIFSCTDNNLAPTLSPKDTLKLSHLHEQAISSKTFEESVLYAKQEQQLAKDKKAGVVEIRALLLLSKLHYDIGSNPAAVDYASQACTIADSLENPLLIAKTYHALGNALGRFKNNPIAAKNFAKSFFIYIKMRDTLNWLKVRHDLIPAFLHANMLDSARIMCERCRYLSHLYGNQELSAMSFALSGMTQLSIFRADAFTPVIRHLDSANMYLSQAAAINNNYYNPNTSKLIATGLTELLYYLSINTKDKARGKKLADSSLKYLPTAIETAIRTGDTDFLHRINIIGLKVHYAAGDMLSTERYADSLMSVAEHSQSPSDYMTAYRAMSILSAYKNDYENAFNYRVLSEKNRDILNSNNLILSMSMKIAKLQSTKDSTRMENRATVLEEKAQKQTTITIVVSIMLTMLLALAILIYHNYKRTQKLNNKINAINEEMRVQSEEIRVKSEEIMDGINYASIIQFAAMPSATEMKHIFGSNLTYLVARNVVSGDFYWASEDVSGRYKLLAVGDCTGHGVPGALLSMLGMSILNYTTRHFGSGEISAGIILDKMRNNFKRTLNQTSFRSDQTVDSIDIALLVFDTQEKSMHYAAAYRPLLLFRYGEMMRMKADSMPIGIFLREKPHFTDNVMKLSKGDIIYLYTDGITDQNGYEDSASVSPRTYSGKRLFKLLKEIFTQPFDVQENHIKAEMDAWRQPKTPTQVECERTDDATIVSVAVNNFIKFDDI